MSLKSIVQDIENLPAELVEDVESIFNKEKAAYDKLAPAVQADLKNGSAILAAINADITGKFAPVAASIAAKFGVTSDQVESVMKGLAKAFNVVIADTATNDDLLAALKGYLNGLGGWFGDICNAGAGIGATVLNGGTPIAIGMSIVKYIYLDIVKPLILKA